MVKSRCGIADSVTVYDDDIESYIEDCKEDMITSGVPKAVLDKADARVVTAITLYVKAYLGNDRSDTYKYLNLYRQKVFRLTLEGSEEPCGTGA
ncbi:hypothetical protein MCG98_18535 [Ruminococcus sp. OA3]|uniref:phage head-tail connector protein n=1 Tax=Ruminococcus sp. OA3 TaxID=2914164 RepID=UPI001F06E1F9|nr:hypothetical protein [Ruminococcus sp. OA3]MCH1984555.1 hypothetical protein [Ruminococcus sp. OA3]